MDLEFAQKIALLVLSAAGQLCMNCKNLINPHECNLVTRCGDHEVCIKVTEIMYKNHRNHVEKSQKSCRKIT